ncbi:hypothetical protein LZC95_33885 [Pendulispora brunnea]|uniref:Cytochrome c domain-containing protein n=1 Tax=Pendulispora brunnea TaxID=2905690 RepID=A0ABZ2JYA6_9BACT
MRSKKSLSHLGLACSALGAAVVGFVGCSGSSEPPSALEDGKTTEGPRHASVLQLTYDESAKRLGARLNRPLGEHEQLYMRVRRGTLSGPPTCSELAASGPALRGMQEGSSVLRFDGPQVEDELLELPRRFDSEVWVTGPFTESMREELRKGTDAIVEACLVKDGEVRNEQYTTLGNVIDRSREEDAAPTGNPAARAITTSRRAVESMEEYAKLCVKDLGEIPFFPKKGEDWKYETFDCRDFQASDRTGPRSIDGVQGAPIPLTVEDTPKPDCDFPKPVPDRDNQSRNYYCVNRCDKPQYLNQGCEPGPTVTTAKNDKGTHWVLLCRAANAPTLDGMSRTKTFRDIAMIGHNPKTGKTCFFQNKIGPANDGEHIPHPADSDKSKYTWDAPKGYCTKNCHAADAFVHSPWIDGALRRNGRTIVPKMGEHPDFPISWLDAPYSVVNMDAQGWKIGQQLVSEEAASCTSCHRIAGKGSSHGMMGEFTSWGTMSDPNDPYFAHVTDSYKTDFLKSHWMPSNVDGFNAQTWANSKWKKAADHVIRCATSSSPECVFADVPRGRP